jgi:hypothetical protein
MPEGFEVTTEAQLQRAGRLLKSDLREKLLSWWLEIARPTSRTPTWDIASTCSIGGKEGLLLVEAKAHDRELIHSGSRSSKKLSSNAEKNRLKIGKAIQDACDGLTTETKLPWALSRDQKYQMSNRFAWSWKLAQLGVPVALVYLGFLGANEMEDRGQPFATPNQWEALVMAQSEGLIPAAIWNREWKIKGIPFVPLIRAYTCPLEA